MIVTLVAAALWALIAGVLLSLLLVVLVAALIALARPSGATRGALWSLVLAAAGLAPVAIFAVMLMRGAGASAPGPAHAAPPAAAHGTPAVPAHPAPNAGAAASAASAHAVVLRIPGPPDVAPPAGNVLVALWALGALMGLAGLGRSLARVRALKARSSPLDGTLATELPWLTTTPGREIYLRLSYETETPLAVGFRRPVILLPTEMATADGLTSIEPLIMHEYAHLARYDDWTNLAQRLTERLFWFNPVVWLLGRRIALEREVAADEAVVSRTRDAKVYASTLWRMAQEMRMPEHVVVAPGAMLTRKQISVRIERLLDETPPGTQHIGAAAFAIAVLALTGVAALAATAPPIELAQTGPLPAPATIPPIAAIPKPPAIPGPPKVIVLASPLALPSAAQKAISDSVASAIDATGDVLSRHNVVALSETHAPVTRELLGRCIGCDFSHRDLHGMDLSNLTLIGDDFRHANLRGVNLHRSKLTGIDLSNAILDDADLSDASLTGVDLSHASMNGANTSGIRLIGSALP